MTNVSTLPPNNVHSCWYNMAGSDSRFVRYSWCTPDHIMGSYWLDPALREDFQIYTDEPERGAVHYAAITGQNLWQGIIFDTNPDARVFPQCVAKPDKNKPQFSTTYVQQVSVQHENVMLVQANRAHPHISAIRVYFGPGMRERLIERNGWQLLEEGHSYIAIRILDRANASGIGAATWDDEHFLRMKDAFAPIVFVTGRKEKFETIDDFAKYLGDHKQTISDGLLTYSLVDKTGSRVSLGLYTETTRLPMKNGMPLDLAPTQYYNNPFFNEEPDRRSLEILLQGSTHAIALAE